MDWLGNIGKGIGDFVSWINPFDDDRKRREQEAQKQQQQNKPKLTPQQDTNQRKQELKTQLDLYRKYPNGGIMDEKSVVPGSRMGNDYHWQQGRQLAQLHDADAKKKPEPPKRQVASSQDHRLIQGIKGYYVMSPTAQKQALEKARSLSRNPSKQQATRVADPMRDAFHRNPTQPATVPAEQRMAQVQANTLNKQVDDAKKQAKINLQRAKAPSVEEYNNMNPNAQRQYIKTLETYRNNQDIRTLKGRSEVARINEALGKIQEEGKGKMGNLPTLLTDLVQGMGDYIGDSALRRGAMEYQDIRRQATGKTNPLGLTPDDVKGVNEAYLRGEIGYDDLVRAFRDSSQLYNLNTRYKIGKDKGIETIDSDLERAGTVAKDTVSGALTALSFAPIGFASNAASLMGRFASRAMQGGTFNVFADLGSQAMNEAGYERTPEEMFQDGVMTFVLGGLLEGVTGGRGVRVSDMNSVRKSGIERIKKTDPQLTDAEAEQIVDTAIKRAEDKKLISRENTAQNEGKDIPTPDEELSHTTRTDNLQSILNDGKVNPSRLQDIEGLEAYEKLDAAYLQKGTKAHYSHPDASNVNIIYKRSSLGDIIDQGDEAAKMGGIPNEAIDRIQVPNQAVADAVTKAGYKAEIVPELDTTPKAGSVGEAVAEQKAQQAKQNSVKQGGGLNYDEMVARLQQRRETGQPAQDTRAGSVQKEAPVDYSDAALEQRLGATGLSQQEVNNLTTQYGMSKMEWQMLLNRVGDLSGANSKPAVIVSELRRMRAGGIHGQTKSAMNNDVTAQRLAKEAEEATPTIQTEGGTVIDTPAGKTNTETGEIIDIPPIPKELQGFMDLKRETVPIDSLKQTNGSRANLDTDLLDAMRESGEVVPLIVDKNGVIFEGNHRFDVLKEMGVTEVPIYRMDKSIDEPFTPQQEEELLEWLGKYNDSATERIKSPSKSEPTPRFIDTPAGRTNTQTGEIIDTPQPATRRRMSVEEAGEDFDIYDSEVMAAFDRKNDTFWVDENGDLITPDTPPAGGGTPPPPDAPPVDAPPASSLADDISNELADVIKRYTDEVRAIGESIRNLGFDPDELRRKMTLANRREYTMTPDELAAESLLTSRYNQAREKLAESGLEFDGQQIHYTPQVRRGEAELPTTREELTNFGYARGRKNAMDVDELEFGDIPTIDYLVRAENRGLVVQESIARNAEIDGRPLTREGVQAAADDTIALQKKIVDAKGSEKVINNDTVSDLNQIGKNEGYVQEVNDIVAGRISQEPREMLTRAGVYDRGFVQYDNSAGYAYEFTRQVIDNNIPPSQLGEALTESIRKVMPDAERSTVNEAVQGAVRRIQNRNLEGQDIASQVLSAYRSVSKAEMFRLGKTTSFADKKMQAVVNEQMNARLLQDNYSKNFAQELDSFIAQRINASLRGMNVVSAAFELGDLANIAAHYGRKNLKNSKFGFGKVDGDFLGMSKRYGEANPHFLSSDLPQVNKLNEIWADESTNILQKIRSSYETGENKLLIFRYVEEYKTELFFRQADAHYRAKGLQGTELVNKVQEDYLNVMLPNKIITANRLIGKLPKSLTQYLNWSVQATKRLGRTVSGSQSGGLYDGMSRGSKIARGVGVELAPKIATAAVLGVPIQQILGMRDWTGATDGDFSGIAEEDKTALDNVMSYVGMSPTLGVVSNLYYAGRREEEAVEDGEKANDNWLGEALSKESTKLIPFYTQIQKSLGVQDAVDRGYFENQDGRVQFDAPDAGSLSHLQGLVTGKTYMRENRDYSDSPDLLSVLQGKASLGDLLTHNQTIDNLMQTFGSDTARDYQRPVTDNEFTVGKDEAGDALEFNYNEWVKEGYAKSQEIGEQRLGDAKAYNEVYDRLRRENPEAYEAYNEIMSNNDLVSPEYWSALTGTNSEGDFDLTLVKMIGDRKKEVARSSGKPNSYDPMYDLPDDRLRSLLQLKSTATGDDLALRNILYKTEWYGKYNDDRTAYYDSMPEGTNEEGFEQTPRVKEWNTYNDQLTELSMFKDKETAAAFPYHSAYKQAEAAFEKKNEGKDFYGSPERDAWMAQYKDGYYGEKDALDSARLAVINQMRVIEGFPPMSADEYAQATEIADTSGGGGSGGGKSGGSYEPLPNIYNDFTWKSISDALKTSKVRAFNPNTSVGRRTNSRKSMGARARGGDTYTV